MKTSLIITTYNNPDYLQKVLDSVSLQKVMPNEVIIADDGSGIDTRILIDSFMKKSHVKILHSWQEDKGFRAARSRNLAISQSSGEYIILVDGDMLLDPRFVSDHIKHAKRGCFIQGSRVLLNNFLTNKILNKNLEILKLNFFTKGLENRKNSIHSSVLSRVFSFNSKGFNGIRTCNMSFFREDFYSVNGFNNEIEGWGREDSELVARLYNYGLMRFNLKFSAIQYHLFHAENKRDNLQRNDEILKKTINNKSVKCRFGVNEF